MTTQIIAPVNGDASRVQSFKKAREGLHISYSQITTYMMCPMKFKFQYVKGLKPELISAALPFGSSIHHALAILYKQLQATHQPPSSKDIQELFADRWDHEQETKKDNVLMKAKESWDSLKDMGVKMISAYYDYADSMSMLIGENVVCVEQNFSGDLGEIAFIGVIDLILRDHKSKNLFHIIDHKTAARRYDETKIATDMQLTAYKWLLEKTNYLGAMADISLHWDVILKLKKEPKVERYTTVRNQRNLNIMQSRVKTILRAIESDIFYPIPGWLCADCGFKQLCEAWK